MNRSNVPLISVIVTTYNRPDALRVVINALSRQDYPNFEIIVADDGSTSDTKDLVAQFADTVSVPVKHAWHEDRGFRAATARNNAVRQSCGEYLLFLDGDCIPRKNWISAHWKLAAPNSFIAGNRILISEEFTKTVLTDNLDLTSLGFLDFLSLVRNKSINRISPIINIPLGFLRTLNSKNWKRVRTCNMSVWKSDFEKVNGFDESFDGWGFEDSDLAVRLIKAGISRIEGAFGTGVLHLFHKENDRSKEIQNLSKLQQSIDSPTYYAENGLKKTNNYH